MNEFFCIMQDVAKLATGGSDIARAEARRIEAERERRAAERAPAPALHPAAIIAVGGGGRPYAHLMKLQAAFAKGVLLLVTMVRF